MWSTLVLTLAQLNVHNFIPYLRITSKTDGSVDKISSKKKINTNFDCMYAVNNNLTCLCYDSSLVHLSDCSFLTINSMNSIWFYKRF